MSESLPKVDVCCCCIDLKVGVFIILILFAISTFVCIAEVHLTVSLWKDDKEPVPPSSGSSDKNCKESAASQNITYQVWFIYEFFEMIACMAAILGIFGLALGIPVLLKVFLGALFVYILVNILLLFMSMYGVFASNCTRYAANFGYECFGIAVTSLIYFYWAICVNSLLLQM